MSGPKYSPGIVLDYLRQKLESDIQRKISGPEFVQRLVSYITLAVGCATLTECLNISAIAQWALDVIYVECGSQPGFLPFCLTLISSIRESMPTYPSRLAFSHARTNVRQITAMYILHEIERFGPACQFSIPHQLALRIHALEVQGQYLISSRPSGIYYDRPTTVYTGFAQCGTKLYHSNC